MEKIYNYLTNIQDTNGFINMKVEDLTIEIVNVLNLDNKFVKRTLNTLDNDKIEIRDNNIIVKEVS